MAKKWNRHLCRYEPYTIPDGWTCPVFCTDMDYPVNCASCGKTMTFGDGYTSRVIHTDHGMGYSVCLECHKKEVAEDQADRKEKSE